MATLITAVGYTNGAVTSLRRNLFWNKSHESALAQCSPIQN
jgi:hypothetical protein